MAECGRQSAMNQKKDVARKVWSGKSVVRNTRMSKQIFQVY
ncbi:hypothetical protein BJB45_20415 [Halomonas huangheensis]|uniref:Uncharacterized protein n=1 Tax=Halomonas huangheensis TaxID=1178482 RepID=W1N707_9GAMM|nr:hypothetical protein BJB45_20415 [Halomonas huangheensis]